MYANRINRKVAALLLAVSMLAVIPMDGALAQTAPIPAGYDLFATDPAETHFAMQIPAGFFGPGSDPFEGVVNFAGVRLETFMGFPVGDADTIVQRMAPANPAPSDTVPIEIVALSLRSVQPIYVTYPTTGESWDVDVDLSSSMPSKGQMTIHQEGTFDSQLQVVPRFTFTRLSDGTTRILDGAELPPVIFEANSFWDIHCVLPALAVPGLNDGFCPGFDGGKILTLEQALFAQHGVWPAQPALEHFECYNLETKPFAARNVQLTDQFGTRDAQVTERLQLCNPVRKRNEPFSNRRAHLVCYTTSGPSLQIPVTVRNQFGSQQLMVEEPTRLCVPSRKRELDATLKRITVPIDHFQCYSVEPLTPLYRQGQLRRVKLRDQFHTQRGVRVGAPRQLCAPVDKNGSRIEHPVAHLVCYEINGPRVDIDVVVKNQFERAKLVAIRPQLLCVPSAKVVLPH